MLAKISKQLALKANALTERPLLLEALHKKTALRRGFFMGACHVESFEKSTLGFG